jgi:ATP-binding protein involved in chromosome partitioning
LESVPLQKDRVKQVIAIASGKGGVGKSTIAINLALSLAKEGAQVGILDADIYGPSLPALLGASTARPVIQDKTIQPISVYGLQAMSIGFLVDTKATLAWRGPMLGKALEQLMRDTQWDGLDYLIIDLPPGTGDIQLTLCQKIAVSGAMIVTTPQDLALIDVRRACEMFNKLQVPMLGVVENMSLHHCTQCGHMEPIFGEGGALKLAHEYGLTLLGRLPLDKRICEMSDMGSPIVEQDPTGDIAALFREIALAMRVQMIEKPSHSRTKFPKIVVEHVQEEKKL